MTRTAPRSVAQYLEQLKGALAGEDPALQQDALYDAEEYLRAEVGQHPNKSEADVLELIASTYGAPQEVADAYRTTEATVAAALAPPARPAARSLMGRFFRVFSDGRAYTSLFLMLLSLATGIVYFTIAVTGLSMSAGLAILIIGIPFFLLFLGLVRVLALAEGRIVESLTGVRMPRRPVYSQRNVPWTTRIKEMLTDRHTWLALFYLLIMLPIGILYFTLAVTGVSVSVGLVAGSVFQAVIVLGMTPFGLDASQFNSDLPNWALPFTLAAGVLLLTGMMHLAKGIGIMHGHLAKALLVRPVG
ncbi:MAG: hypothetical protein HC872_00415 [Gammaproteobacteria bacterium]|nr:hypothetical protein [Gammaproteobacteria bacterium]